MAQFPLQFLWQGREQQRITNPAGDHFWDCTVEAKLPGGAYPTTIWAGCIATTREEWSRNAAEPLVLWRSPLKREKGAAFVYDFQSERVVKRTAGGPTTIYIERPFEVTFFPNGSRQQAAYILGPSGLVASRTTRSGTPDVEVPGVPGSGSLFLPHESHQQHHDPDRCARQRISSASRES